MRSIVLVSVFMSLLSTALKAQLAPPSADEILKEAYKIADKEKKNVFVIFHASWCVWCHKMDTSMNDPSCKQFFDDNYVIRHLIVDESADKKNQENPGAAELRKKLDGEGQGIPFWVVMDKKGKLLFDSRLKIENPASDAGAGQNIGCPASENEVGYFVNVLKKTSSLNDRQLEVIRQRFRENDH